MTERPFRRQLMVNSLASGLANGWAMLAALISVPLLLSGLGREAFGVWALVMTFSATNGWMSLADLGVVVATTRQVSAQAAVGDDAGVRRSVATAFVMVAVFATIAAGALAVAAVFLPQLFKTPPRLVTPFRIALTLMAAQVIVDQVINVAEASLEGLQRVDLSRAADALRRLLVVAATSTAALVTHRLVDVAVAAFVATVVSSAVAMAMLGLHLPGFLVRPSRQTAIELFRIGREIAVLRPLGVLQRTMDRALVGVVLGPGAVALVEVATQLQSAPEAVLSATSYSVVPASSWLGARSDRASLSELVRRGTKYSMLATVPVAIAVGTLARPFLTLWVGRRFDSAAELVAMGAACVISTAPLAVGSQLLVGLGRTRVVLRSAAVALVINFVVSVWLLHVLGVIGVFVGTLVGNLGLLVVMGPAVLEEAGIGVGGFLRTVVWPVVPAALAQLAVAVSLLQLELAPIWSLVLVGTASLAAFVVVARFTALSGGELAEIRRSLNRSRDSGDVEHSL